jgi:aminoglycoside N3'-acetyltransferase
VSGAQLLKQLRDLGVREGGPLLVHTSCRAVRPVEGGPREGKVGNADVRLCRSRDIVAVAVEHLASDPLVFLCPPRDGCEECDAARASIRAEDAERSA